MDEPWLLQRLGWGGLLGPASFVTAWAIGGAVSEGYDPVDMAISRLAADGAPTRVLMTAGFLGFTTGVLALSRPLWRISRPAAVAAAVTALATVGVAATPLDTGVDSAHAVAAGVGYATLAAVPILAFPALRRLGAGRLAAAGAVAGTVSAACLLATTRFDSVSGLLQRAGLTSTDLWLAALGVAIAKGRLNFRS